jgi:hypothetical protein
LSFSRISALRVAIAERLLASSFFNRQKQFAGHAVKKKFGRNLGKRQTLKQEPYSGLVLAPRR